MEGWIDIHAHILPQVDDGAADWEDSAGLLEAAARQGFGHIIATPHFNRKSGLDLILEKYEKLELLEKERNPEPVGISLGQEILYFEDITEYLDQGKALTLAGRFRGCDSQRDQTASGKRISAGDRPWGTVPQPV